MADFLIRISPKGTIPPASILRLPYVDFQLLGNIALRVLRLNCLTDAYAPLWEACYRLEFTADQWTTTPLGATTGLTRSTPVWDASVPLRIATERRQAQLEVDALVALSLGVSADELCTVYRTQFPVLYGYDRRTRFYDANGRLVPNSVLTARRQRGDRITRDERTAENPSGNVYTYELPFVTLDREADMRVAYAHFEQMLENRA